MNIPRHVFTENVKNDLLEFLEVANENKNNAYCDFNEYERLKNLLPLDNQIKQDLKTYVENANICIDITHSDDETDLDHEPLQETDDNQVLDEIESIFSNSLEILNETNTDDVIDSVKDSLSTQNAISNSILRQLSNLRNEDLEKVFYSLANQLSLDDVQSFWRSLMGTSTNDNVIVCYIRFLFLPRVKQEFSYEIQAIFLSLSQKYSAVFKNQLVRELLIVDPTEKVTNRVLLQYIGALSNDFNMDVLRTFIYTSEKLHPNYISIIDALLNSQSQYDILSKLIEIMSNSATEFSNDNTYGKLLFNVISLLEKDVSRLEQPIKHILGTHRSIWKIKVQKIVANWFDDSLTQSFV